MTSVNDLDIINICGSSVGGECGYCHNVYRTKSSYGIVCENMKTETYFHLMNRGWRRCGTYFYKPINESTCCPLYTIRCDTTDFKLSRSQRQVLKNFRKFLITSKDSLKKKTMQSNINARGDEIIDNKIQKPNVENLCKEKCLSSVDKSKKAKTIRYNMKLDKLKSQATIENRKFEDLLTIYQERRKRKLEKQRPKSLSELLDYSDLKDAQHSLEVKTFRCHPENKEFADSKVAEHKLYVKYQCAVHHDAPDAVNMKQFERFLVRGSLYPNKTADKIDLKRQSRDLPQGQYHQQYWLDGTHLIAVGVIDLVPCCLSSVYLFYDPDYAFLDLGVYSALVEINFVNELRTKFDDPDFRFYYMGFYTHACVKMRYKAQYAGSVLLCPVTYTWVPVKKCQQLLDGGVKFAQFAPPDTKDDFSLAANSMTQMATNLINVVVGSSCYKLKKFIGRLSSEYLTVVEEFARLAGARALPNLKIRIT